MVLQMKLKSNMMLACLNGSNIYDKMIKEPTHL